MRWAWRGSGPGGMGVPEAAGDNYSKLTHLRGGGALMSRMAA